MRQSIGAFEVQLPTRDGDDGQLPVGQEQVYCAMRWRPGLRRLQGETWSEPQLHRWSDRLGIRGLRFVRSPSRSETRQSLAWCAMDRRPSVLSSINLSGSGESIWCLMRPRAARTQEFVLRWRSEDDPGFREIVRQQWNFSPPQTTREIEDYQVDLRKREGIGVGDRPRYWRRKHVRVARKPAVGLVHAR